MSKHTFDLLSKFVNFLTDIVYAIDLDHNVVCWNNEMEKFSGKKIKDVIHKKFSTYDLIFNTYGCETKPLSLQVLDGNLDTKTMKVKCVFGKYLSFKAALIHDEENNVIGSIETIRDMSEYLTVQNNYKELYRITKFYLDSISDLIWIECNGLISFTNKTLQDLITENKDIMDDIFFKRTNNNEYIDKLKINNKDRWFRVKMKISENGHCYMAKDITDELEEEYKMDEYINTTIVEWQDKHANDTEYIMNTLKNSSDILKKMSIDTL